MAQLMLSVMGAFAELERSLIKERQREGIAVAKTKGVYTGLKPIKPLNWWLRIKPTVAIIETP